MLLPYWKTKGYLTVYISTGKTTAEASTMHTTPETVTDPNGSSLPQITSAGDSKFIYLSKRLTTNLFFSSILLPESWQVDIA